MTDRRRRRPGRTCRSSNGSIIPCSSAIFLIHRSALIAIGLLSASARQLPAVSDAAVPSSGVPDVRAVPRSGAIIARVPCPEKKYPSSNAAVSGASEPWVALFSIDAPNSFRSVPASAFAGSVAPISVRHFLMASGASSARTTAGPDDMNSVRLPKNGRSRCTA